MAGTEGKLTISIRLLVIILIKYLKLFPATFPRLIKGLFVGEVLSREEKTIFKEIVSGLLENPVVARSWQDDSLYHGPFPIRLHLRLTAEFALVLAKSFGITNVKDFVKGALIHDIGSDMGDTRETVKLARELELPEDVCYAIQTHMAFFAKYPPISRMDYAMVISDWYSHILDMVMTVFYLVAHPSKILWFLKQMIWEGFLREFFAPHLEKH